MKIRTMLLDSDGQYSVGGSEQLQAWHQSRSNVMWVDIESRPDNDLHALLESLGCNQLAIRDSLRERHPPKVEAFEQHTFLLFLGTSEIDSILEIAHQKIAMWVGSRILITFHHEQMPSITYMWDYEQENKLLDRPGALALKLLHHNCGLYLEGMLEFEEQLADLEDGLFTDHSEDDMRALANYRSSLRRLRRVFNYHKDLSDQLLNHPEQILPFLESDSDPHRRNVFDRCERLHSLCDMYYEICGDLVEGHISLSSYKLSQAMKILTIISALFVPLTFIAGIYGMNFEHMPELAWKYAYFAVLSFMAVLTTGLLILFRKAKWL